MDWLDVRFICLVKVEIGTAGAEEGGDNEVEFTIRKTVQNRQVRDIFPLQSTRLASRPRLKERLTSFPNNTVTPLKKV